MISPNISWTSFKQIKTKVWNWIVLITFMPYQRMYEQNKHIFNAGVHFRLMCSHRELTKDHVLTSVYIKIFRTVTRNAVNKSVWRKKDCSWLPLNKHAMNIWLSSLRIRAHLSWRTGNISMFSMCSELTPRARIPDTMIPQFMQPWCWYFTFLYMMMMMMTMMTNIIPYWRTKTHIWDFVFMGFWASAVWKAWNKKRTNDEDSWWLYWWIWNGRWLWYVLDGDDNDDDGDDD